MPRLLLCVSFIVNVGCRLIMRCVRIFRSESALRSQGSWRHPCSLTGSRCSTALHALLVRPRCCIHGCVIALQNNGSRILLMNAFMDDGLLVDTCTLRSVFM